MPRFSFRFPQPDEPAHSIVELPSLNAARHAALRTACDLLSRTPEDFWDAGGDWQMTVADDTGLTLFTLIFYATNAPVASMVSPSREGRSG